MTNDKQDSKEDDPDQQLRFILEVFGRKQKPGEPPLESLPPSQRLVPNAPLNERESNVIVLADCRFYGIKPAPPDNPIYQSGYSLSFVKPLQRGIQKPEKKTLTQLCQKRGIKELPADDPIYRRKFVLNLQGPSQQPIPKQQGSSVSEGQQAESKDNLIDRNSKEPEDRKKFLYWLAAMSVAFRAPQAIIVARVREVCRSAMRDGVNREDVYEVAKSALPSRYPAPPSLDLVNP